MTKSMLSTMLCASISLGWAVASMSGCQTSEQGVKSTFYSQWTTVAGDPVKVTDAAEDVLQDFKLNNITAQSTSLDGVVTAYTADNTKITIDIKKDTATTSQVSVNVGSMGDPQLGTDILARIQKQLGG